MNSRNHRKELASAGFAPNIFKIIIFLLLAAVVLTFPLQAAVIPQRIVSGMPSITEMLYALGVEDRVVGITTNCNYPPQTAKKERVGGFFLNLEKIAALKPDLVILMEDAQKREIKRLQDFGLPVYSIKAQTVNEVMQAMLELGEITGAKESAEKRVMDMRLRIKAIRELVGSKRVGFETPRAGPMRIEIVQYNVINLSQPRALVLVGWNPMIVAGGGTLIDDIITIAGAQNIAGHAQAAYPQYSFETLLKENPDYLIIPEGLIRAEEIKSDPRWQSLSAVKSNRLLFVNADILSRPGPRVLDAVEKIAAFIY